MADSLLIAASDDRLFLVGQVRFPKDKLRILAIAKFIVGDNAVFENIVAKEADPPTSGTVDEQRQRAEDVFPKLNDRASRTRLSARITIRE